MNLISKVSESRVSSIAITTWSNLGVRALRILSCNTIFTCSDSINKLLYLNKILCYSFTFINGQYFKLSSQCLQTHFLVFVIISICFHQYLLDFFSNDSLWDLVKDLWTDTLNYILWFPLSSSVAFKLNSDKPSFITFVTSWKPNMAYIFMHYLPSNTGIDPCISPNLAILILDQIFEASWTSLFTSKDFLTFKEQFLLGYTL